MGFLSTRELLLRIEQPKVTFNMLAVVAVYPTIYNNS
jgi:hypothetical protein